ncbi:MAG: hypothetical protein P0Y60_14570 [Candidatus Microbacterium colombiense]|nr:MAG: hypothetical protein P0Y60_14570 [Microbacterium sp.]
MTDNEKLIEEARSYPPVAQWDEQGEADALIRRLADALEATDGEFSAFQQIAGVIYRDKAAEKALTPTDDERELLDTANTFREQIESDPTPGSLLGLWLRTATALDARVSRSAVPEPSADDGLAEEMRCQGCGARNPVWWAANGAWNIAVGGDASREAGGMLCPTCFHRLWLAATGAEPQGEPYIPEPMIRAALRAASSVTGQRIGCNLCGEALPDGEPHLCISVTEQGENR